MEKQQKIGKTALIYCRVGSNQVQNELVFWGQESACVQHALSLGYVVGRVTKEVQSGRAKLRDRPLLSHDLADLQSHSFEALIVYSVDRLSRDPRQMEHLSRKCMQAGVILHFVLERLDIADETSLLQFIDGLRQEHQTIRQRLGK